VTVKEAAMTVKIPLRLHGIDLRDPTAYDRIDPGLSDLFWMSNGAVSLAVVLDEEGLTQATAAVANGACRIAKLMPGVFVAEVYDELVSLSDIAARTGVAHEAVRLWALGKRRTSLRPFPTPRQVVSSGPSGRAMALYAWREVASWVREVLGTDPDEGIEYLDDRSIADLNVELAAIREELSANRLLSRTASRARASAHRRGDSRLAVLATPSACALQEQVRYGLSALTEKSAFSSAPSSSRTRTVEGSHTRLASSYHLFRSEPALPTSIGYPASRYRRGGLPRDLRVCRAAGSTAEITRSSASDPPPPVGPV
jgi:hypothetical protein